MSQWKEKSVQGRYRSPAVPGSAGGEEVRPALSSRFFSNWRWPRGHLAAVSVPSVRCQHAPCPRDAPAPSPCGKLISGGGWCLLPVGQPGLGNMSR